MRRGMPCEPSTESSSSPWIFPVFLPHAGCPHRCVFCDQHRISSVNRRLPTAGELNASLEAALSRPIDPERKREVAFFGGNFFGLPTEILRSFLDVVSAFRTAGRIQAIRCSTRPDTVSDAILSWTKALGLSTVELGAQSMNDAVLDASHRGHRVSHTIEAVERLKRFGVAVGLQLMVGLPEDSPEIALQSANIAASLKPDVVRIYPTVVLSGTPLADRYIRGEYRPMALEEAVSAVADMMVVFQQAHIPVIRIGLQASETMTAEGAILAGPWHPAFGHLVASRMFRNRLMEELDRRRVWGGHLSIVVHPRDISRMRGDRNENLRFLAHRYGLTDITVRGDIRIERNSFDIKPIGATAIGTKIGRARKTSDSLC